jgi:hypothetical protein
MRISQYQIIRSSDLSELIEQLNENIEGGWQPFGNMVVEYTLITGTPELDTGSSTGQPIYMQPIVVYSDE